MSENNDLTAGSNLDSTGDMKFDVFEDADIDLGSISEEIPFDDDVFDEDDADDEPADDSEHSQDEADGQSGNDEAPPNDIFGDTGFADVDLGFSPDNTKGKAKPKADSTKKPEAKPKKQPTKNNSDDAANPLEAAAQAAEAKDAEAAMKSIFEKPPVFKYAAVTEPIEDASITFEDLRISKADEFPELGDGKRVTWTVEYGKIVKSVANPKGITVTTMKSEIETSKEFLDSLKKAKDKNPDCLVKPSVRAQVKGKMPSYKGIYPTYEDACASDKIISLFPAKDGKVYEMRKQEMGTFITPTAGDKALSEVTAGFIPALPLIPHRLVNAIIGFFRHLAIEGDYEALVNIYWDKENEHYIADVPKQTVTKISINSEKSAKYESDRYIHYMDIHSHNSMKAFFSATDDNDEKATRLYAVMGRVNNYLPELKVRISNGGKFLEINPSHVFETVISDCEWPTTWGCMVEFQQAHADKPYIKGRSFPLYDLFSGSDSI